MCVKDVNDMSRVAARQCGAPEANPRCPAYEPLRQWGRTGLTGRKHERVEQELAMCHEAMRVNE